MSAASFTYEDFEATRERLVKDVNSSLSEKDRSFLLSFKRGNPDWDLFPVPDLKKMQAIQWKLMNIQNLKSSNPERHIGSQFNSDWTNKLLICIDEVLFNKEELTERIKYLSTTNYIRLLFLRLNTTVSRR